MKLTHQRGVDEYTTSNNLDKAVTQQIIKVITGPISLEPLENHITGYFRGSAPAMIQFLFDAYGNITPLQLDANDKLMKEQLDPLIPIIYLFSKIQDGVNNAYTGNTPCTVNQVLAIAFNHVFLKWHHAECVQAVDLTGPNKQNLGQLPIHVSSSPRDVPVTHCPCRAGTMRKTWPMLATTMLPPTPRQNNSTQKVPMHFPTLLWGPLQIRT
jgi:hypothetical protein